MPNHEETSNLTGEPHEVDQKLFELLNRYVQHLHGGETDSRSLLIERHPDLSRLFDCLDDLDSLAPPPDPVDAQASAMTLFQSEQEFAPAESNRGSVPATHEPGPDDSFGKFELLREVGRGGMGVVFEARQTDLDRTVAIKMIVSGRLVSDDEIRRFYAEARAAGRIKHPNIVGIHEVGQIHGQHYFAMDLIRGPSLTARLRQGPVEPEWAARCLAAVARAVNYLHENNIVHRDLKPSNILLGEDEQPYVTDFGLAKVFDADSQQTQTGTIIGTPCYMAPEQAAGRPAEVGPHSDVYSLGAILYELLTGRPPFRRPNPLETLVDVLEGEPTLPTRLNHRIPRGLELICLKCLEKDPHKRYATAADLADDLERFLRGEPIEARPTGVLSSVARWSRREPALSTRLGGLLAAAAIIQLNFVYATVDLAFHMQVMGILGLWGAACVLFQRLLNWSPGVDLIRFAWSAADIAFLSTLLWMTGESVGLLLVGYPLLIASAGLFFRVTLVWFTTFVTIVAFAALIWLRVVPVDPPHYAVIFAAVLAVLGFVVAYQVERIRVLSQYYENRRLP